MTGFEPGSSGVGSDHSANCATTTSQGKIFLYIICVTLIALESIENNYKVFLSMFLD